MTAVPHKTAILLTIGSELLKGSTLNTNAQYLGQKLLSAGFRVREQLACDDVIPEIQNALRRALSLADLVIVSGGLGPTPDDVTRQAIAKLFKRKLVTFAPQKKRILRLYKKSGRAMPKTVECEAQYPETAIPMINRCGIALGFAIRHQGKLVVVLPGVPRELIGLMEAQVLPYLRNNFLGQKAKFPVVLRTVGLSEPVIMDKLGADFFDDPFEFGIYPHPGEVTLRLYTETAALQKKIQRKAAARLKGYVYSVKDISLAQVVGERLMQKKQKVAIAESCTGGQLSAEFTRIPGSSRFYLGGIVAYDNSVKRVMGVSSTALNKYGAVSEPVALQLAGQVRTFLRASWGIGITGIAGPGGGTRQKPIGTVYIAVEGPRGQKKVQRYELWGTRDQIQKRAVTKALELAWHMMICSEVKV